MERESNADFFSPPRNCGGVITCYSSKVEGGIDIYGSVESGARD